MDKIAIISDIHGNLEALKTTLDDIKKRNISRIFCLGDIVAKGIHQQECVDLVKENCEVILEGNCEAYYAHEDIDLSGRTQAEINDLVWHRDKLTPETRKDFNNLDYCYEFYMSGRLVRLLHAHPERVNKLVGNIDTIDRLYSLFLPSLNTISDQKADVLIYGHIHTPFIQKIYNRVIVNTGSVGNSLDIFRDDEKDGDVRNTTLANYLILTGNFNSKNINEEISYELIFVPYDIEKELSDNNDSMVSSLYEKEIREGKYRDMDRAYKDFELRGIDKSKI